jgi:formylglycine-generating enzyme required for sulfatase activity/tetratricopeptide (TPR) repeat protein
MLLVLDQFEQWLHARRGEENTELVAALRHCDGRRIRAVVLVRDDFWLAASRFMRELEIRLVEGEDSALVDLFDPRHAKKVLTAFGRAYGALPERIGELTAEQESFLDQSISGLAQDGKIVSVRLALFAEMMKGKPWTAATLKEVGGTGGVGLTFLEETFSASTAPPEHRFHQKAAQAVLNALLPESGSDIKGQMRSRQDLLEASEYANHPRDFDDLIRILDSELRLITPTDPGGVAGDGWWVMGENTDERAALPRAGSVAARHGSGREVLSGDKRLPETGAVWTDESDPAVRGVETGEHRGGTGAGAHEGIPQPSEHRPGLADGGRNALDLEPAGRVLAPGGSRELAGADRSHRAHAERPAQSSGKAPRNLSGTQPATRHSPPGTVWYQLTHDYLVHSLRDWLTRKQRETRRGRAELRLAERSSQWNAKPESRHLPSALEWANIRLLTKRRDWSEPQRKMMKRAGRLHGFRGVLTLALLTAGVLAGIAVRRQVIDSQRATHAAGLVQRLLDADTPQVPEIVDAMRDYRPWVDPSLRSELERGAEGSRRKLHASLALLPVDASQVDYLLNRLVMAAPSELPVLRDFLKAHRFAVSARLWSVLESGKPGDTNLLPSASALAYYDPDDLRWGAVGAKVAQSLVSVNPVFLGSWLGALRPVRDRLTAPLTLIFQAPGRPEAEHILATNILADYASDDPERLAELLMVSDPKAYVNLFPVADKRAEQVLPVLQAELVKKPKYSWNDPPLDPSWTKPAAAIVSGIERAQGAISERFAFCQTMPIKEFLTTADVLRESGYRPVRIRPYADGQLVRVAAVWHRDARDWRIASGLSADLVPRHDERNKKDDFLPVDVAGYIAADEVGKPAERYIALWVARNGDDEAQIHVGASAILEDDVQDRLKEAKLVPRIQHAMIGSDGRAKYCGIWGRPSGAATTSLARRDQFEASFEEDLANQSDQLLIDIAFSAASKPESIRNRAQAAVQSAENSLKAKPDNPAARLSRAMAYIRLGENQKALDDLQVVIGNNLEALSAKQYKIIALARIGKKQAAQSELAKLQKENTPEHSRLYLAAVLAAEMGEGADKAFETLEASIAKQPKDADLRYEAARAFSLASQAVSRADKSKGRQLAERGLQLLGEIVKNGDADFGKMEEDPDLDPVRDEPAFAEIMKASHPDRRLAAVWTSDASFEAIPNYGLDPASHLQESREMIAQGYRPVSWSATRTMPEGPLLTASVWHRPVVAEDTKDRLAERQARAAIALARLGKADEIWPLLRHSDDPRLRSFIVNWLNPLGADPKQIAAELDRTDRSPRPAQRGESRRAGRRTDEGSAPKASQKMDAILFHPETSMRRAIILALGTYGSAGLSPGEREPLVGKLLDLYRDDADVGIHGAAEWTLRKWGLEEKLKEADSRLMKLEDRGERRWYVNGQQQTFALIDGPVEFRMGPPPTETERITSQEPPRRMVIPRRFAIADREVTVEQFQRFLKLASVSIERFQFSPSFLHRFSPDPQGPWLGPDWYTAAHYCNWLSEQEGLPRDQWCYIPNESGAYAEGMSIAASALERTGYRLPTEAEWEYACRAGAATSRYYGNSIALRDLYAWNQANSEEHAWMGGRLLPNDLGLFDMLGNVFEWCQDGPDESKKQTKGLYYDHIHTLSPVKQNNPRLLRGGAFSYHPALVRCASRYRNAPSYRSSVSGFRLARTYR